jgi:hypothetical protein
VKSGFSFFLLMTGSDFNPATIASLSVLVTIGGLRWPISSYLKARPA